VAAEVLASKGPEGAASAAEGLDTAARELLRRLEGFDVTTVAAEAKAAAERAAQAAVDAAQAQWPAPRPPRGVPDAVRATLPPPPRC
jgi:hypothetical protein